MSVAFALGGGPGDSRGFVEVELYRLPEEKDSESSLMLSVTASHPFPVPFSMSADEARALAAKLVEIADAIDATT